MNQQKLLFVDVETTGFYPERNGLIQISGCVQIGDEVKEFFNYYVRPFPEDEIDDEALEVTGIDRRQLLESSDPNYLVVPGQHFEDPKVVFNHITTMFAKYVDRYDKKDKFHLVGYNAHNFDMPFMREFWNKIADHYLGSWLWFPCLDVMLICAQVLQPVRAQIKNFSLSSVARHCGIEVDDSRLHDSLYDIELTRKLWLATARTLGCG